MSGSHPRLVIRSASPADGDAVRAHVFAVLAEFGLVPDPLGEDADLVDVEAAYIRSGGRFEVLQNAAGEIVGTVALRRQSGVDCELRKMYFAPGIRGQGWGRVVLHRMIRVASAAGYERMNLETASVLAAAIGLYRSFGFRRLSADPAVARCDHAYSLGLAGYVPPPLPSCELVEAGAGEGRP